MSSGSRCAGLGEARQVGKGTQSRLKAGYLTPQMKTEGRILKWWSTREYGQETKQEGGRILSKLVLNRDGSQLAGSRDKEADRKIATSFNTLSTVSLIKDEKNEADYSDKSEEIQEDSDLSQRKKTQL